MPFRRATALVAIEREGILDTEVVELNGTDPTIKLKVKPEWGPNVYVSVLSIRGRLREVPWYSFFTWGWRQPLDWWHAFRSEGKNTWRRLRWSICRSRRSGSVWRRSASATKRTGST
jgi:hypothetical protein